MFLLLFILVRYNGKMLLLLFILAYSHQLAYAYIMCFKLTFSALYQPSAENEGCFT